MYRFWYIEGLNFQSALVKESLMKKPKKKAGRNGSVLPCFLLFVILKVTVDLEL